MVPVESIERLLASDYVKANILVSLAKRNFRINKAKHGNRLLFMIARKL